MKKILLAPLLFSLLISAYAMVPVDEKVLQIFNETFREAKDVVWNETEDYYSVAFVKNDIRAHITYDKNGHFIESKRYYSEDHLPFTILMRVKEKYRGKSIFGVTETVNNGIMTFYIKLEDSTHFWLIRSTLDGTLHVTEKLKKP